MDTEGEMVLRAGIIAAMGIGLIEGGLKDDVVGMPQAPGNRYGDDVRVEAKRPMPRRS